MIHDENKKEDMHDSQNGSLQEPTIDEVQQWKDRALRVSAEFDNYKKRQEKDRQQQDYFAQRQLIMPLLSIIDNFERATKNQSMVVPDSMKKWVEGIELIAKDLEKYLRAQGIESIATHGVFDPEVHEAINQVEDANYTSGTIVNTFEQGYRFKGNILRPAKVSVAL